MTPWLALLLSFGAAAVGGGAVGGVGGCWPAGPDASASPCWSRPWLRWPRWSSSAVVSTRAMYLDGEQSEVVLSACAGGAAVGLLAAVLLGRRVRRLEESAAATGPHATRAESADAGPRASCSPASPTTC